MNERMVSFSIKNMSTETRRKLKAEAAKLDMTLAELLDVMVNHWIACGWQKDLDNHSNLPKVRLKHVNIPC